MSTAKGSLCEPAGERGRCAPRSEGKAAVEDGHGHGHPACFLRGKLASQEPVCVCVPGALTAQLLPVARGILAAHRIPIRWFKGRAVGLSREVGGVKRPP